MICYNLTQIFNRNKMLKSNYNCQTQVYENLIKQLININIQIQIMSQENNELEQFATKLNDLSSDHYSMLRIFRIGRKRGFCNISYRKIFWPLVVQLNVENLKNSSIFNEWVKKNMQCGNYGQVMKDALTSFSTRPYPIIQPRYLYIIDQQKYRKKKRQDLLEIINSYICANKVVYFRGLKDISSVLLTIFGRNLGYFMTEKLTNIFFKDFLSSELEEMLIILDKLIFQLVINYDPECVTLFKKFEDKHFQFTSVWITTWFSTSFDDLDSVMRIWDYLICSTPEKIIYLCAAVILSLKQELLKSTNNHLARKQLQRESVCQFYKNLNQLGSVKIEGIIKKAIQLERNAIKLSSLSVWGKIDPRSQMIQENYLKDFPFYQYLKIKEEEIKRKSEVLNKGLTIGGGILLLITIVIGVRKKNDIIKYLKQSFQYFR